MKFRSLALAALLVVGGMPSISDAAPRRPARVCNLVQDAPSDVSPAPADPLDIVSADIASNGTHLTGVIRLRGWAAAEPTAPTGRLYTIRFEGEGASTYAFLTYFVTPNATSYVYGYRAEDTGFETAAGTATGVVDATKREIRMSAPIAALSANNTGNLKPGKRITGIEVVVSRWVGAYADDGAYLGTSHPADTAAGTKSYFAGSPSCVKVNA